MKLKLVGALIAWPVTAHAMTGNELWEYCKAEAGTADSLSCVMYVSGAVDAMTSWAAAAIAWQPAEFPTSSICVPAGVTYGQLADIVTRQLRDHPEHRHQPAPGHVAVAVHEAYPCKADR